MTVMVGETRITGADPTGVATTQQVNQDGSTNQVDVTPPFDEAWNPGSQSVAIPTGGAVDVLPDETGTPTAPNRSLLCICNPSTNAASVWISYARAADNPAVAGQCFELAPGKNTGWLPYSGPVNIVTGGSGASQTVTLTAF